MDNPLTAIRQKCGWSLTELALALGVAYARVWEVERGLPRMLPRGIREGLRRLGVNPEEADRQYVVWRQQAAERLGRP